MKIKHIIVIILFILVLKTVIAPNIAKEKTVKILVKAPTVMEQERLKKSISQDFIYDKTKFKKIKFKGKVKRVLKRTGWVAMEVPMSEIPKLKKQGYTVRNDRIGNITVSDAVQIINATQVWMMNDTNNLNVTGRNITIAIIDSGIDYTHPDLGGCFGSSCKVMDGYDFTNDDSNPMDDHGHGTHCAGIAAANGSVVGVAPDARLVAFKVCNNDGNCLESDVIAAIEQATDPNGDFNTSDHYDIISLSLGFTGNSNDALSQAVNDAFQQGAIVVVAAANDGPSNFTINSPGSASNALTVGITNDTDSLISWSSRGPNTITFEIKPEIVAPGYQIISTALGGGTESRSGTSMSTPLVAGAAALLKQYHPNWTNDQIRSALIGTSKDLGLHVTEQGSGRLQALAAINTSFISEPATLSIGKLNQPMSNITVEFNLSELSNASYNVSLNVSLKYGFENVDVSLDDYYVELNNLNKTSLNLIINITNSSVGVYNGMITANNSNTNINIPFWVLVTDCDIINNNTNFTQSLSNCILINASNLIIDGKGYSLNGNTSATSYGIDNFGGHDNITIQNFARISNFTHGLSIYGTENLVIKNTTIIQGHDPQSYGMFIDSSSNLSIYNSTLVASAYERKGMHIQVSSDIKIIDNNISTSGGADSGIYLYDVTDSTISSNIMTTTNDSILLEIWFSLYANVSNNMFVTTDTGDNPIEIFYSLYSTISNNNITQASNSTIGVVIYYANDTLIENNVFNITTKLSDGIDIWMSENTSIISNIIQIINKTGSFGIFPCGGYDTKIYYNFINITSDSSSGIANCDESAYIYGNNITGYGSSVDGIRITYFENGLISNNTILTTGINSYGMNIFSGSGEDENATIVENNIITMGSNSDGIQMYDEINNMDIFSNNITTYGNTSHGVYIGYDSNSMSLYNNIIITKGYSNAIYLYLINNINFTSNIINSTNGAEIYVKKSSDILFSDVVLDNNNISITSLDNVSIDKLSTGPENPAGTKNLSDYFNITDLGGGHIDFELRYEENEVTSLNESSIRVYKYNDTTSNWSIVNSSTVDTTNNIISSGNITGFSIFGSFGDYENDPPIVMSHSPTGTITTSSTTLTINTNENCECRYSTSAGIAYASMPNIMTGTLTSHTASLSGLSNGVKHYYVRCNDTLGNIAITDYDASFTVDIDDGGSSGGSSSRRSSGSYVVCTPDWFCNSWTKCVNNSKECLNWHDNNDCNFVYTGINTSNCSDIIKEDIDENNTAEVNDTVEGWIEVTNEPTVAEPTVVEEPKMDIKSIAINVVPYAGIVIFVVLLALIIIAQVKSINEPSEELINYIKKCRDLDYTDDRIKKRLLQEDYNERIVDKAFQSLK